VNKISESMVLSEPFNRNPIENYSNNILTSLQPLPACELWSKKQWIALAHHFHNSNPPDRWVMGFFAPNFKNGGRPEAQYKRAKTPHSKGIPWAWQSLCGKGKMRIAYTPYSKNEKGFSRWAGVDFDAHSSNPQDSQNAFKRAFNFFLSILAEPDIYVVVEASGRGWHVFLISKTFHPVSFWVSFIKSKLKEIGLEDEIEQGTIEIFPPDSEEENEFGRALRAPGSWHPTRNDVSRIIWENVTPLMDELVTLNIEKRKTVTLKDKKDCFSRSPLSSSQAVPFLYPRLVPRLERYSITKTGTRNNKLKKLVGELFHQVSVTMAERFVIEQYRKKTVPTEATEHDHIKAFGELWAGLQRRWLGILSQTEDDKLQSLDAVNEQEAFRIIRSYASYAQKNERDDFAIGMSDLGARLGMTRVGTSKLVNRFITLGILKRTREYVAHKFSGHYAWKSRIKD
jgi:hypothetical protein